MAKLSGSTERHGGPPFVLNGIVGIRSCPRRAVLKSPSPATLGEVGRLLHVHQAVERRRHAFRMLRRTAGFRSRGQLSPQTGSGPVAQTVTRGQLIALWHALVGGRRLPLHEIAI